MGANESSNLGVKMNFFSNQILFKNINILCSAAQNLKEFFDSDFW